MSKGDQHLLAEYFDMQFEILNDRIEALTQGLNNVVEMQRRLEERMKSIERLLNGRDRESDHRDEGQTHYR